MGMGVAHARWRGLVGGLWFVPLVVAIVIGGSAFGVVQIDEHLVTRSTSWVFGGSPTAARTVLTTIAGSLITVAGLTFSITMIVLQLASSQFSPRVLPTVLGDRVTQVTVGTYVGIFIFCLVGLRTVGGAASFVPRATVTAASALGVAAVMLLIVFIHHVSTMIQVSQVAGRIGRSTLRALDTLYPEPFAEVDVDANALLAAERVRGDPVTVCPARPGYVRSVDLERLADAVDGKARLVHVTVAPGDFVSIGMPVVEVWRSPEHTEMTSDLSRFVVLADERDLVQDAAFGVRQLTDVALRAISPAVNDPTTAVTCIGYIRSILERLVTRSFPGEVRALDDGALTIVARRVGYDEYLESLFEIGRHASGDARVARQLLRACAGIRAIAEEAGATERAEATARTAKAIGAQALAEARSEHDLALIAEMLARTGV